MKPILLLYLLLISWAGNSQEIPSSTQQQLENLGDEDLEDDALLQQLAFFKKHQLNLNAATVEELQSLRILTDLQIQNFIRYRKLFGKLIDIYELQAVPTFDIPVIQKIRPYVYTGPVMDAKQSLLSRFGNGDQYVLMRFSRVLEKSKGYNTALPTHYSGDANRYLFRYRYQFQNLLYYGIVADKDAGEPFTTGPQKFGFDFYSVHFFIRNLGRIKALAIGDYVVNLGQGLIHWQSMGFGKSVDVMNIKRQSPVLLPYRASGEFYFNRGVAATIGIKNIDLTAFISHKKFSANIDIDSIDRFTSFGTSGYHRTPSELADRNRVGHFFAGSNIRYKTGALQIGLNAVTHRFSLPMQKRDEAYNHFAFSGKTAWNTSADYSFTSRNAHFFGEFAMDKNFNYSFLHGIMMSMDRKVDVSVLFRNLSKKYQSVFGNAFAENSLPSNERGMYAGIVIRPATSWVMSAYADFYQFDFVKYRVSAPSKGCDYLAQLSFTPDKRTELNFRFRTETKPIDMDGSSAGINFPVDRRKQSIRFDFASHMSPTLLIKGRTEVAWYDKAKRDKEEGFLSYIEVAEQWVKKIRGSIRLQYFETGSYDSRIYAYETDVLYGYSIPAFYDRGFRYYINMNYEVVRGFTFWCRAAQTLYSDKQVIGSGLDEIKGTKRTEIKLQVHYIFK